MSRKSDYSKWYYSYTAMGRFNRLREGARLGNRSFNINPQEFVKWYESQSQICYYCGRKLTKGKGGKHILTDETFDRKDNGRGYSIDNIVLACRRCNLMKGSWLTERQTLEIAERYFKVWIGVRTPGQAEGKGWTPTGITLVGTKYRWQERCWWRNKTC